ncbi:MAG TPA: cytochrome c [Thermoanaerobaculia bacterium]|nr:cytochrome c [Thermoanaerobaculia bacterium]
MTPRHWYIAIAIVLIASLMPATGWATDAPHSLWLKAKCALCHGEDGGGNTKWGGETKVPDLRADALQKLTNDELAKHITQGHDKMPAFKAQLTNVQISLLVAYIRDIAPKKKSAQPAAR